MVFQGPFTRYGISLQRDCNDLIITRFIESTSSVSMQRLLVQYSLLATTSAMEEVLQWPVYLVGDKIENCIEVNRLVHCRST